MTRGLCNLQCAGEKAAEGVSYCFTKLNQRHTACCVRRWLVSGPAQHQRAENGLQADQWSYNVPVPPGAIYRARVSLLQARACPALLLHRNPLPAACARACVLLILPMGKDVPEPRASAGTT